jgi:hypothetical protein
MLRTFSHFLFFSSIHLFFFSFLFCPGHAVDVLKRSSAAMQLFPYSSADASCVTDTQVTKVILKANTLVMLYSHFFTRIPTAIAW